MKDTALREFHISRQARDRYQFDDLLYSSSGNVIFPNIQAVRVFAQRMNERRDVARHPERAVRAGQVGAMGLIDEILHYVVGVYREQRNPEATVEALDWLDSHLGRHSVDRVLVRFVAEFPSVAVYRGQIAPAAYLAGETAGTPNRQIALEELLMLWLANVNPAFSPYRELFDDAALAAETDYRQVISSLHDFFDTQPAFGPDDQNLVDMLRSPAIAVPHSLSGQLEYCLRRWGALLGRYAFRLLSALDLLKEEERGAFEGPGEAQVPYYESTRMRLEPERFSPDRDWMPELTLIAKNAYVWLDQLSKRYGRPIRRLDEIPDEELDTLARWGLSGLWLIGLWERSPASRKIKQMMGNPEAVASAYSLYDYQIAGDLGGEAACQNLRERAWARGIRLASDMVPNHMSIDSRWVIEHPDWFISLDYSPYPSYSFSGPDLSGDDRVGIFIEDHYYDRTDAAVVFKRVDRWTGSEQYIYHGNDGTRMPWNDTAQLNYLIPRVREAVIQTILHVARQFPVIRFDAAMTLAKQHYQRLWFPEPGTGGAIPSRAEHGLTVAQFDAAMPEEFWREVVDRVAAEAPDTLLLAEAFWLMEGYFVRTLGMHRVYNSAFMNMLRDEDNAKYRSVIKNTLEFDPEILKRYVNFMNNPDERTAVDQFGKGDKYFGICTLMVTLPGLPMFGHGQIEGYVEKYGMEYQRAYYDEQPDWDLVRRHEREIFPLLHRRHLFAGVDNFLLYDFFTPDGQVNEDVFAYSNRAGDERGLVVYNNRFSTATGWIRTSAAYSVKTGQGDERRLVQRSLGEGLGLRADGDWYTIFRDQATGLEYIRNSREIHEQGLAIELHAYGRNVFLDFREVWDGEGRSYGQLARELGGRGVPSVDEAVRELALRPVLDPLGELVSAATLSRLEEVRAGAADAASRAAVLAEVEEKAGRLVRALKAQVGGEGDEAAIVREIRRGLEARLALPAIGSRLAAPRAGQPQPAVAYLLAGVDEPFVWGTQLSWLLIRPLGKIVSERGAAERSRDWIDEYLFGRTIAGALRAIGLDEAAAWHAVALIKLLLGRPEWRRPEVLTASETLAAWFADPEAQRFLQVNRHDGVVWFNKEAFESLLWWMLSAEALEELAADREVGAVAAELDRAYRTVESLRRAAEESGYQVERLLATARQREAPRRRASPPAEREASERG